MAEVIYPIGTASFSDIREKGWLYIDKTMYIDRMVRTGKYFFLSRPRRFGKSLLVSTMEAYFKGRRELFNGLALEATESDWISYPVLRMDLSAGDMSKHANLLAHLNQVLGEWESEFGIDVSDPTLGSRFRRIILTAYRLTGRKVVVLIDEYDNPLFSTLHDSETHSAMRDTLREIYAVLKSENESIHFCFLTGITRFSKMSVFSGLNNLRDLTLSPEYSGVCGITEEELARYCSSGIAKLAESLGVSSEKALRKIKEQYDGYHFGDMSLDIYNPYSLMQALADRRLLDYWFVSGTSKFLWDRVVNLSSEEPLLNVLSPTMGISELGASEEEGLSLQGLLFQTGYLTLKKELPNNSYRLGIPNNEVKTGIMRGLLPLAARKASPAINSDIERLQRLAYDGDVDGFMQFLKSFLAGVSYRLTEKKREIYFENNLYIIFNLIGLECHVESETSYGRMDIMMRTPRYIYVIELKLNRTAKQALEQIKTMEYHLPFQRRGLPIIRLGINFSTRTHNISTWAHDKIE